MKKKLGNIKELNGKEDNKRFKEIKEKLRV